jgi:hypothetical protein
VDNWQVFANLNDEEHTHTSGLTLHYSITKKKWVCGYGKYKGGTKNWTEGATMADALQARIDLENK